MCAWATKEVGEQEKDSRANPFVCGETDASCNPVMLTLLAPLRDLLSESLPVWRWGRDWQCSFAWRVPDSPCKQSVNSQTNLPPGHLLLNIILPSLESWFLCLTYRWGNWGMGEAVVPQVYTAILLSSGSYPDYPASHSQASATISFPQTFSETIYAAFHAQK